MALHYKKNWCENCQRWQSGDPTFFQKLIFYFLLALFVIPGLIYFFVASPKSCRFCGLRGSDKQDKELLKDTIRQRKENGLEPVL